MVATPRLRPVANADVPSAPGTVPALPGGPIAAALTRPPPSDDVRPALLHLVGVGACLAIAIAMTYVIPPLERFQPWVAGEPPPVIGLFLPPAAASDTADEPAIDDAVLEALEGDVVVAPPPVAERDPEVIVTPAELVDVTERIEDERHVMDAFYRRLLATAHGDAGAITRIAHFGDSTIALDGITRTVRENLQRRFGDSGHGFVIGARGSLPYRHHEVRHESEGSWRIADITHLAVADGRYGLGGVQSRAVTGATTWFATEDDEDVAVGRAVSRFDVLYQAHDRGGHFRWRLDEGEWHEVETHADATRDEVLSVPAPDGPHELEIRAAGHGETRLYGVVMEREVPGVVYDSLGFVGARAMRMTGFDPEHLRSQLETRGTDLVVIGFGGNDADDERSEEEFEEIFRRVALLVRTARPDASCLLFSVLDQAERDERGRVVTLPTVERIVNATRSAARAEGCAFFDAWHAMGGAGSMGRWYRRGLASSDFRHASPEGYRTIGNVFYLALLQGLADFTARAGGEVEPAPELEEPIDAGALEAPLDAEALEAPIELPPEPSEVPAAEGAAP